MAFTILGLAAWGLATQVGHVAEALPSYRDNIRQKIADVRQVGKGGSVERVQETLEDIKTEMGKSDEPRGTLTEPLVVTSEQVASLVMQTLGNTICRSVRVTHVDGAFEQWADRLAESAEAGRLRSSIFMPRSAS